FAAREARTGRGFVGPRCSAASDKWGKELQSGAKWGMNYARTTGRSRGAPPTPRLRPTSKPLPGGAGEKGIGIQGPFRVLARREEPAEHPGQVPGFVLGRTCPRALARSLRRDLHSGRLRQV